VSLGEQCVDGDNIKIHVQKIGKRDMDWIDMARDMDRWRYIVNVRVP
jgi:hypothetical protein